VVSERWHYATSAYQGVAGGAGPDVVARTTAVAVDGLEPDRAVLLDVAPEAVAARRARDPDRIERRAPGYHARVAAAFRAIFAAGGGRLATVPASGPPDDVEARVWEAVRDVL
jgi:dTMP kinase